jgi:CheY-like chemotaxis protein
LLVSKLDRHADVIIKRRVLVVEDHPDWRRRIVALLRASGFMALAAGGRDAALRHIAAAPKVDVIVLDILLENCLSDSEEISRLARDLNIPVVAVSGPATREQVARLFGEYHISAFIAKDQFDKSKFIFEVSKACRAGPRLHNSKEVVMGNKYVARNVLSQGEQSHVHDVQWHQQWIDASQAIDPLVLGEELGKLRSALKTLSTDSQHDVAIGAVAAAEEAANRGDRIGSLKLLAGAGKWVLGVATKIGVEVASKAIEQAMKCAGGMAG